MTKDKLKKTRTEKGFSQQDVAKYLNINQTGYSRKENGTIPVTDDEWERLAKLLNVEVEEIKEDDSQKSINQNFEGITDSNYIGSNNIYYNVPEFILNSLNDYIDILKKENQQLKDEIEQLKK
ncbi:helix-turn-helix transcriptional regulator [Chryseobacterium sp.]|uniref:helix-turn-helix transcriptional regulator n=1 Tax=Chryseobacterium sp. TaxID=1871047 RepID=UPI0035AFF930